MTAVGLRLSDEAIRIAVGFRLGSQTCQSHSCVCGAMVDAKGLHCLSSKRSAPRQIRHAQMNDIIWRSVKKAQYPAIKEPVGLSRSDGKDRMGQRWSHGREGSRWLGTWPSQIRLRTLILARHRRERQRQTERRKTKRQSTPIWPRRTISCQSQSRQVVPGMNWLWSSSRS